jgi:D-aspartate ligase
VVRGVPAARCARHIAQTCWIDRVGRRPRLDMLNTFSRPANKPLACVMGGMDLVRPLGLFGVRAAVVTRPGSPALYSRFTQRALCRDGFCEHDDDLVEALEWLGAAQPQPPVLFFEEDAQLLLVSRHRDRLARTFRFAIADRELVEDLVDKSRFHALAERLGLPVPATRRINPGGDPAVVDLRYPLVIKPLMRSPAWDMIAHGHKALQIDTPDTLQALWPRLKELGRDLLAQELVPGGEERIESYHVYVDRSGAIAAEFTGRKIRTYPTTCGHSTALEISDAADVRREGRDAVEKLGLTGVAKLDFKRAPDGRLALLEINPRFNLWHHLGAVAGVNIPALVYADLAGLPRPATQPARVGTRWCSIWNDFPAARMSGLPLWRWLPWMLGCEAKSAVAWDDPMPLLRSVLHRGFARANHPPEVASLKLHEQAG